MTFKISKIEAKRVDQLTAELNRKREAYNDKLCEFRNELEKLADDYNETREELRGFIEDIIAERESAFEDRSDNWKEGDRGLATEQWLDLLRDFESAVSDDLEPEVQEDYEFVDELRQLVDEGLPTEPEY